MPWLRVSSSELPKESGGKEMIVSADIVAL